jgi:hypothetical protein
MDRVAVFVDAGYLFAQGSVLASGAAQQAGSRGNARPLPRSRTKLDEPAVLAFLEGVAQSCSGLPLLRIYWYDGTNAGPTPGQSSLASRPNVKLRLGIVNSYGEQKGVDSLIITDLISLSRNRAMADAVLVTGDEDIRVGVQQAQELGVRVHLVGLEPAMHNQSYLLRQEADTMREVSKAEVDGFLSISPPTPIVPIPVPVPVLSIAATPSQATSNQATSPPSVPGLAALVSTIDPTSIARAYATSLAKADAERVVQSGRGVPPDLDRPLLAAARASCGQRSLTEDEKRQLRKEFISICKTLV